MTKRGRFLIIAGCGAVLATTTGGCVDAVTYKSFLCRVNGGFPEDKGGNTVYCHFGDGSSQQAKPVRVAGGGRFDPFTARFKSRVVSTGRRRGRQVTGVRHKGTIRISPRGSAKRLLRGFTRARYASSGSVRAGGSNGLGRLQGYLWATFSRGRGAACLRVDAQAISVDGPPSAVAQFRSVGGTGRAARLALVGSAPLNSGTDRVNGNWRVTRGKARRAPAACRRLARIR
jgi:hypothetical protein